ncbi:MAG: aminopeptidase [Candidatus Krumholzibacteria bacterium]|nr:aminopeptidase [Candidatus Krumholzibacteria bacterium]
MDKELLKASIIALRDCLRLQKNESLLIVTDTKLREIGAALRAAALELGNDPIVMEMEPRSRDGEEPPEAVTSAMMHSAVVIAPTERSLTHTAARREACRAGARVATMPGIRRETMIRCLGADYYAIADRTKRVTERLTAGKLIRVTTRAGTDITLPIKGIKALASTGLIHAPGEFGNLPSGEAYLMPVEGASSGVFVVDGSMAGIGSLTGKKPITIRVEHGQAIEILGGAAAKKLLEKLEPLGAKAFNVAEFGIGTNDAARITGSILEDEKVMGTIHIALGNNMSMGGTVDVSVHLDGLVKYPTVELDGAPIMDRGKLLI